MAATWDPAHKDSLQTLSGGNLIATSSAGSGSVNSAVFATNAISTTVKQYFEITVTGTVGQYFSIGVMNGSAALNANIAATNGICLINKFGGGTSNLYLNGSSYAGALPAFVSGQVIRVAVDRANNRLWWAVNNNIYSGSLVWMGDGLGTAGTNPATGVGGANITPVTGTIYPAISSAYTGDVATLNGGATAFAYAVPAGFSALDAPVGAKVFLTSGATWTVPSDWNNAANTIECIGGGGGGWNGTGSHVGTGGEGGHYAKSANITLTPSGTVNIAVGAGGTHGAPATAGAATWFGGTSLATSFCGAVGGAAASNSSFGASTPTTNDVGNVLVRAGGIGGPTGPDNTGGSAGGGAAGPGGVGGNGGLVNGSGGGGGGGAGNSGGAGVVGSNGASSTTGGQGGAAGDGTAGGAGTTTSGVAGSHGSGGGGGGSSSPGAGGAGGPGVESTWDASHGPGGGGGAGGGGGTQLGGAGGLYGGGGGGGAFNTGLGGDGAQGIIVISYTPLVSTSAQLTQIALEQWAMPNAQAQLTQVALEQWASLALAPPTGRSYALTASRAGIPSVVLQQTSGGTFAVPLSAIVAEAAAAAPPPVTSAQGARVMILA